MPIRALQKIARTLVSDRRGNVAVLSALAMPVLIGSLGVGAEVASWYGGKRNLQNAADSAAIAAATNGTDEGYDDEARAVAAQYGLHDGQDGVTVAAAKNVPCPGGAGNDCYSVTISRDQPLFLAQVVGYKGDVELGGSPYKRISSRAVAIQANGPREYCVLALGTSGDAQALRTNGAPFANLSGCNVMSNTDAKCDGHDLDADVGDAHGINTGCGNKKNSHVPTVADPYTDLAKNIPDVSNEPNCNDGEGYPKAPAKKKDPPLPDPRNVLIGPFSSPLIARCGDVKLMGPVTIGGTEPTVLVIKNGTLDLDEYSITTLPGASLTIIFTGDDNTRNHTPIGKGTLDIEAPKTGPWKGVAMYQDPKLTGGIDIEEAGNTPTWKITGLAYLPHAAVTFSGAVSKSSNGLSCFAMVVDNVTINGTGSILDHGECPKAGLTLPYGVAPTRGELVS